MAIKYGFFNSIGGDRKYNADDIGKYLMGIISSGVYADASTSLQVLANDGMDVEVQPGRAMLHYHYMENDSPLVLTLDRGGTQDRVDAIVARLDLNNRLCEIVVKKGTEAAKPAAPAMERTDTIKEYMLASVYITKLSASITQLNITDTRADNTVCGWVTGVIEQVDTSTLFAQWQAAYEEAYAAWGRFLDSLDGDILPIPSADDVGKVVMVNDTYDGYVLGQPKAGAPWNIADNSDWSNPVNQRGKIVYNSNEQTIDRWRAEANGATGVLQLNNGYITMETHTSKTRWVTQRYDDNTLTAGETYTVAIWLLDGSVLVNNATIPQGGDSIDLYLGEKFQARLKHNSFGLICWSDAEKVISYNITHVGLFKGAYTSKTIPDYQPKGYGAELAECMRYFERIGTGTTDVIGQAIYVPSGATCAKVFVPYTVKKRTNKPTCTVSSADQYRLRVYNAKSGSGTAGTAISTISAAYIEGTGVLLNIGFSATNADYICALQRSDNATSAWVDISADIL